MILRAIKQGQCRSCHSRRLTQVLELESMPYGDNFSTSINQEGRHPVGLVNCESCELIQFGYQISSSVVFRPPQISAPTCVPTSNGALSKQGYSQTLQIDGRFDQIFGESSRGGHRIISLEGFLVQHAATNSREIESWEELFSAQTVDQFIDQYGQVDRIKIDNSTKNQHPLHISNVADVRGYVDRVTQLLKSSGEIHIRLPALFPILRNGLVGYIYHEHQSFFCAKSIICVFAESGLSLSEARYCSDGLNAEFKFSYRNKDLEECLKTRELKDLESRLRSKKQDLFGSLKRRLENMQTALEAELKQNRSSVFAGFGASVAGISTMYQLKLESRLNFLFDDSESRIGLFSPSGNLEVKRPDFGTYQKTLATIILVPLYADRIIEKHREKLGTIVVPKLEMEST
jgi:hypothetical protein